MSEKRKVIDSTQPTFITLTVVEWVDIFTRKRYCELIDDALNYCIEERDLKVHAYVYMSNHVHLIVSSEKEELPEIIRDFKKHTSKRIIELIRQSGESRKEWLLNKFNEAARVMKRNQLFKVWRDGYHPVSLDTNAKRKQKLNYIHSNPVKAGYVAHERDWLNSSYLAYENTGGLLNVKVEPLILIL